jgi:Domain of unknown function (DUF222)
MTATDFDLSEWDFLPPLDDAALPDSPPPELVLIEWVEPAVPSGSALPSVPVVPSGSGLPAVVFADPADAGADPVEAVRDGTGWRHPGLAEIARLVSLDFAELDAAGRIGALADQQRQASWWSARQLALLSLISARDSSAQHWCVEEVGCALGLSGPATQNLLKNAERLCRQLPATFTALAQGRIGTAQATTITQASYPLPDDVLPDYETRVLRHAHHQSTVQLKRIATRAVLHLDPASAERKHQRAVGDRHVRIAPAEHGTSWLMALLPAAQAHLLYDRIDGAARLAPTTDPRTMDQLRADALVNAVLHGTHGQLPTRHGQQPAINVTVALSTLTGHDQQPGWLDGYGPITAGYARQLAHDPTGTWRRLITDPATGHLLDYGTTRYRPPQHLSDHIIARDGECTFPYCTHHARRSDLDHITAYPHGSTNATNLHPLHRRHHNAKTQAHWQAHRNPTTGTTQWTSPTGKRYHSTPPQRWPLPEPATTAEPATTGRHHHSTPPQRRPTPELATTNPPPAPPEPAITGPPPLPELPPF